MGRGRGRAAPRRARAGAIALALAAAGCAAASAAQQPPASSAGLQSRPNVVVVETDDQTVESMRVMSTVNRRLAAKGVTFSNSLVNFSLCCPSRATFLTGQYAHNHHVLGNSPPLGGFLTFERLHANNNLAVWLQAAGYRTALIGKYLNGYYADPVVPPGWSEWDGGIGPGIYDYNLNENGKVVHYGTAAGDYKQDVLTRKAVEFVSRNAPSATPFFVWLTYTSPHTNPPDPNPQPPSDCDGAAKPAPRDANAFASDPLPTPPSFNEADVADKPAAIRDLPLLTGTEIADVSRKYRCALGSLLSVDRGVGKVLNALRRSGDLANTFVIYTSDNGFLNGEHRIAAGKNQPYEESIRVPLIIRGPGIPQGRVARDLAINADLAPTITELTGARPGLPMDGRSLLPAARHPRIERGRALPIESSSFHAIRTQRFIYVTYRTGEEELYDLARDPYELQNAVGDPGYGEVRSKLAEELGALKSCQASGCRLTPRVSLSLNYSLVRGRACAQNPIRARIAGAQAGEVVESEFKLNGEVVADDTTRPFTHTMPAAHGPSRFGARIEMIDGRRLTTARGLQVCG
jgi:N-acetylglucosamine-6-sulfatase